MERDEIIFEFQPLDAAVSEAAKTTFAEDEVLESNAFTGAEIVTILLGAGKDVLAKVLSFFTQHRESLKSATIKIGKESVELTGYSMNEVRQFIDSGDVEKVMTALKNKNHG